MRIRRAFFARRISKVALLRFILCLSISIFLCRAAMAIAPTEKSPKSIITYTEPGRSFALHPTFDVKDESGKMKAGMRLLEWDRFQRLHGAQWTMQWNPLTGAAARISGFRISTGLGPNSPDKAIESWARGFINENKDLLGVGAEALTVVDLRRGDGRSFLTFQQVHDGLPVYGAVLKMQVNQNGDLVKISSNCFPAITYKPEAGISVEEATQLAAALITGWTKDEGGKGRQQERPQGAELLTAEKVIFPMPAASSDPFRLCYLLKIHLNEPLGNWVVVLDATRGIEYVRYNDYRFGTVSGTVTGRILPMYYNDTPVTKPLHGEDIHVFAPTPVYSWNMDTFPGWTVQGLWAWGTPNGQGGDQNDQGPTSGHTGSTVYGYNLTGGYENSLTSARYLTTPAINCSALTGTHLIFWQWLGIDAGDYDKVRLEVSNNGSSWIEIWHNLSSATKQSYNWEQVVYDISSVADGRATVYIRWGLGPTSGVNTYCGWYVDDVEICANGGTSTVSPTGAYAVNYTGTGNESVYADMSGPYADVYYEDGKRLSYSKTVATGTNDWLWQIPPLTPVLSWDLSTNPGWAVQGQWAYGQPLGLQGDPSSGHTGSNVYGYNLAGAYPNNITTTQYLTTTAFNCSTFRGTHVRFWRWLGVEYWDNATIQVSNDGNRWRTVYVNMDYPATRDTAWTQVTCDISGVADGHPTVYLRWGLDSDGSITYCGWNIDDIEILADTSGSDIRPGVYDFDEVNVFYHTNVAHTHIKTIDPAFTGMDYKVPAIVRIGTNYANAFWDGEGINFGEGDSSFLRNLALFCDVVYHEYQHGVTHHIYPGSMLPYTGESGALDEGWADFFGCDITSDSMTGDGDLVIGEPWMRNLDNTLRVPDDWAGEVHDDGRIVGGAMWDLREALGSSLTMHLIHFARFALAERFFDYYEDVLLTDDNNGNLSDGTPHMDAIARAFGKHGIGGLLLQNIRQEATLGIFPNGKLDAGETGDFLLTLKAYFLPRNVQATLTTTEPLVSILSGSANYGDFGYAQEKTNPAGSLRLSIDSATPEDKILDLTLGLTADGGYSTSRTLTLINAPDQILYDEGKPTSYFGYGTPGGGFAVRFTPPRYPVTINSVRLFPYRTSDSIQVDLHAWDDDGPGGTPGTELIFATPITLSNGGSWKEFPVYTTVLGVAYEWNMSTDPGWYRQGGWAFGQPTGGGSAGRRDPTSGATGPFVYGYNLSGDYPNNMSQAEYLQTTAFSCAGLRGVRLQFQRWLGVEDSAFDHATVEVSNNGVTWTRIWENGDSSMADQRWTLVTYDISAVADMQPTVYVRWGMGPTDSSITYCGWNIDDVKILFTVSVRPGIMVTSGDIYLGWTEKTDTYYTGYSRRNSDRRSWVMDLNRGWLQLDAEGYVMDLMVRARYRMEGPLAARPSWRLYR